MYDLELFKSGVSTITIDRSQCRGRQCSALMCVRVSVCCVASPSHWWLHFLSCTSAQSKTSCALSITPPCLTPALTTVICSQWPQCPGPRPRPVYSYLTLSRLIATPTVVPLTTALPSIIETSVTTTIQIVCRKTMVGLIYFIFKQISRE